MHYCDVGHALRWGKQYSLATHSRALPVWLTGMFHVVKLTATQRPPGGTRRSGNLPPQKKVPLQRPLFPWEKPSPKPPFGAVSKGGRPTFVASIIREFSTLGGALLSLSLRWLSFHQGLCPVTVTRSTWVKSRRTFPKMWKLFLIKMGFSIGALRIPFSDCFWHSWAQYNLLTFLAAVRWITT